EGAAMTADHTMADSRATVISVGPSRSSTLITVAWESLHAKCQQHVAAGRPGRDRIAGYDVDHPINYHGAGRVNRPSVRGHLVVGREVLGGGERPDLLAVGRRHGKHSTRH